ncbi:GntR family transcriptional regulator [Propionivibrio dicarboxylicus]|nr:GntR family transcriptional regulator [Propionivibrio dicarboxylicus]
MTHTEHGNRSQVAAQRLRQMIVAGELAPGQRISEREIGTQLVGHLDGLSRTPLREALKILAAEGLVTIAPNRGATVTALSIDEVEEALDLLVGLEGLAAEATCARIGDAEIAAIEALHEAMHAAYRAEQLMDYFEINQAIHQHIVDAAGNRVLSRIYAAECARIRRYRYAGNHRHERWERAIAEHDQILAVLKERNGTLLRELLRAHHQNGWQVSRRVVAATPASDPATSKSSSRRRAATKTNAPE